MKNKNKIILYYLMIMFFFNIALSNEKIDYSSNTIKILENGKIISGEGDVQMGVSKRTIQSMFVLTRGVEDSSSPSW